MFKEILYPPSNAPHLADDVTENLSAILKQVLAETQVPGIGLAVSTGGKRYLLSEGVASLADNNPLTHSSQFEMSCLMKFFVSLVTAELAGQGILSLNTPVTELDELQIAGKEGIKLRHLMSHSSGYRGLDITDMQVRWNYSWERFAEFFKNTQQSFVPGTVFNYEHSEHVILDHILRKFTGCCARQLVTDRLFAPLGITPGSILSDKHDARIRVVNHAYSPATAKYAPVALPPFCQFWEASLPDWTITLENVLAIAETAMSNPALRSLLNTPVIALPRGVSSGPGSEKLPVSFGLICAQYENGLLGHNGSMFGQTCGLRFDPASNFAVAVGINAWSPQARDSVLHNIAQLLAGLDNANITRTKRPSYQLEEITGGLSMSALQGRYIGSYLGEVNILAENGGLRCLVGPAGNRQTTFAIVPAGNDQFSIESKMPVSLKFVTTDNGPSLFLGVHSYRKV